MAKRSIAIKKNKIKNINDIKWFTYAKNACVVLIILFLIYIGVLSMVEQQSLSDLIRNNIFVIVGFIVCTTNLYVWNELKRMIDDLKEYEDVDAILVKSVVMVIGELVLLNYITAVLIIIGLYRVFVWKDLDFKGVLKEAMWSKKHSIIFNLIIFMTLIGLTYLILFKGLTV